MTLSDNAASWQNQLAQAITDPEELITLLELDQNLLPSARIAAQQFSLRVPRSFVARMRKGEVQDPLLRQVMPLADELLQVPGYSEDPVAEQAVNPIPGLLHKYQGRVLLTVSGACGVHCRYCFRRYFPYDDNNPGTAGWDKALDYISSDASITEVILSGGDPLAAADKSLQKLVQKIASIAHVDTLRVHSRLPIVIPERITPELVRWFSETRLQAVLVVHCNHAQEIDAKLVAAMQRLSQVGVTLLNQTVLLKGVNDSAEALIALSKALFKAGILPYYLHLLDKVQGAAHFEVTEERARALHWSITQGLPGYLVPKLVQEVAGAPAKLLVK